jgi:precorrin-3B synthase
MTVRGWCPDLFHAMPSGDGLLTRVKPVRQRLDAASLRQIARAAKRHGNGAIDLTSRGNLQIRGLTAASAVAFAADIVAAGLASPDPATERRRNVVASPLAGLDPICNPATLPLADALTQAISLAHDLAPLPGKYLFAVDGGGRLPLGDVGADIVLRAADGAWHVGVAGGQSVRSDAGKAVAAALKLARAGQAVAPARLHAVLENCTEAELFAAAGFAATRPMPKSAPVSSIGRLSDSIIGLGVPFGALDADLLADLADRFGDGTLRLTPWRAVLLTGVHDLPALRAASGALIQNPGDPRARMEICPGRPACASAAADIRADAALLAASLPDHLGVLHLSGCAKGCAHPTTATLTLVATPHGYAMIRHGRAGDAPSATGLSPRDAAAACASFDRTAA